VSIGHGEGPESKTVEFTSPLEATFHLSCYSGNIYGI
jgi:hypothetical protein